MPPRTAPDPKTQQVLVGRFSRYRDLKRAVDSLRVARIPDRRITVLGRGLEWNPPADRRARGSHRRLARRATGSRMPAAARTGRRRRSRSLLARGDAGRRADRRAIGIVLGMAFWRVSRDNAMLPESGHVEVDRYDLLVSATTSRRRTGCSIEPGRAARGPVRKPGDRVRQRTAGGMEPIALTGYVTTRVPPRRSR